MSQNQVIQIAPSEAVINEWLKSFVPACTLYFVDENQLSRFHSDSGMLVIPRSEFDLHPAYREINLANAYTYWMIDQAASHVLHVSEDWLQCLSDELKHELLINQVHFGRGLMFSVSDIRLSKKLESYSVKLNGETYIDLQRNVWKCLTRFERRQLILDYAKEWESWETCMPSSETPKHIAKWANTFSSVSGSNCLAATLFAITKEEWFLTQWIHSQTFLHTLIHASYREVEAPIQPGDVVTFWDSEGRLQHATYCIAEGLFFNKNGQTIFNPWKVIDEQDLFASWKTDRIKIFRYKQ